MKAGAKVKLTCPPELDKGGNIDQYSYKGAGWVEKGEQLYYELEVDECDVTPHTMNRIPPAIIPNKCIYFTLDGLG